ncbi:hypothetical protein [Streptomyces longwoodensis]|uniref:hypothetical protein n=1 Tax=Streptomyces longwoodensis TaxID=68231 RepID=UPI0036EF1B64
MRLTVWHNTDSDGRFYGYLPDHPMLRTFSYTTNDGAHEAELKRAVTLFNSDLELLDGTDREIAAHYRFLGIPSFSKGDGLSIRPGEGGREKFWASNGRDLLPQDRPFTHLALGDVWGTHALGHRVRYAIPAMDSGIREGLFETDGSETSAQEEIAAHHGRAPHEVIVIAGPHPPSASLPH